MGFAHKFSRGPNNFSVAWGCCQSLRVSQLKLENPVKMRTIGINENHWFSLISIDFHWFSLVFAGFEVISRFEFEILSCRVI